MVSESLRDERGATAVEYGLVASLIVLIMLVGLIVLTDDMNDMYAGSSDSIATTIHGGQPSPGGP